MVHFIRSLFDGVLINFVVLCDHDDVFRRIPNEIEIPQRIAIYQVLGISMNALSETRAFLDESALTGCMKVG